MLAIGLLGMLLVSLILGFAYDDVIVARRRTLRRLRLWCRAHHIQTKDQFSVLDQRGVALPMVLFALAIMSTMVVSFVTLGAMEVPMAKNHAALKAALYAADAGIEQAYDTLAKNSNWAQAVTQLSGPCPGCPAFVLTGTMTENGKATVISVGTVHGINQTVRAVFTHPLLDANGAIVFTGQRASFSAVGNAFEINGNDLNGACSPKWGIATETLSQESSIETALSSAQKDNILGRDGMGTSTITDDPQITSADILALLPAIKKNATVLDPLNLVGVNWGSPSQDVMLYANSPLTLSGGVSGYGILVVENSQLTLAGDFHWNGVIIVTGHNVGVKYLGGGNKVIEGALMINELDLTWESDPNIEFDVAGNAKVRASCQAINRVSQSFGRALIHYTWRTQ